MNNIFTLCSTSNKIQHFEGVIDPSIISWEDVADYFSVRTIKSVELIRTKKISIPKIRLYQDVDFILNEISTGASFCISKFFNVSYKTSVLWEQFCDWYPNLGVDFHLYGGLLPESTSFPAHNDLANNYIIQFDGQCEWVIYKEQASFEEAFNYNIIPEDRLTEERRIILNPGDIIYIPSGKYHKCIPLGKRLSLSVPIL
jgi:hypothetical protein